MKLGKFEVDQLSLEEMEAIRAGSACVTGSWNCVSATVDYDSPTGDSDED